jgi:uncharacterized protein (DUF1697 family)
MNTYISLLRGINVSGQKKIKMAELKTLYQSLNFESVVTYIQSGNVVFQTSLKEEILQASIEAAINEYFKFTVPVLILTKSQLANSVKSLPFINVDIEAEGSKIILFFLSESVMGDQKATLEPYLTNEEQLEFTNNVLYLYCPKGLGKSKLTNKLIETKLKLTSTARNIKTVKKLLSLTIDL